MTHTHTHDTHPQTEIVRKSRLWCIIEGLKMMIPQSERQREKPNRAMKPLTHLHTHITPESRVSVFWVTTFETLRCHKRLQIGRRKTKGWRRKREESDAYSNDSIWHRRSGTLYVLPLYDTHTPSHDVPLHWILWSLFYPISGFSAIFNNWKSFATKDLVYFINMSCFEDDNSSSFISLVSQFAKQGK